MLLHFSLYLTGDPCIDVQQQLEEFKTSGRFRESKENQILFKVKERAVEVIDLFFNYRFYIQLQVCRCDSGCCLGECHGEIDILPHSPSSVCVTFLHAEIHL